MPTTRMYRLNSNHCGLYEGHILQVTAWSHPDSGGIKKAALAAGLSESDASAISYTAWWDVL